MNVTLCSAFRNAESFITRYAQQIHGLHRLLAQRGDCLHLILCEGDSTDNTQRVFDAGWHILAGDYGYSVDMFHYSHGGQDYGSVVNAERFANLAKVWGQIWQRIPEDTDAVLFVESDLVWEPATMLALLDDLEHVPAVAPMVMLEREGYAVDAFYDTWAYRRNGAHFTHQPPYVPLTVKGHTMMMDSGLEELDSAGSCIAMRGDVARGLVWPAEDVVVGICRQIRERGGSVWLDPKVSVIHR